MSVATQVTSLKPFSADLVAYAGKQLLVVVFVVVVPTMPLLQRFVPASPNSQRKQGAETAKGGV